jgi:preprotein translocase subunit SecG
MINVVLVVHLLIAVALVAVVLLQKSEGGGLGIGGGGGGMSGFMTGRSTANLLTRTTAILAGSFMLTSIALTMLAGGGTRPRSIIDESSTPAAPAQPAAPQQPSVPLAK